MPHDSSLDAGGLDCGVRTGLKRRLALRSEPPQSNSGHVAPRSRFDCGDSTQSPRLSSWISPLDVESP